MFENDKNEIFLVTVSLNHHNQFLQGLQELEWVIWKKLRQSFGSKTDILFLCFCNLVFAYMVGFKLKKILKILNLFLPAQYFRKSGYR